MFPQDKLNEIRGFLRTLFADTDMLEWEDLARVGWTFRLSTREKTCMVTASREFLTRRSADEIQHTLTGSDLARYIHHHSVKHVTIMPNSLVIES